MSLRIPIALVLLGSVLQAQNAVVIDVQADQKLGQFRPSWAYFGYDEPNYTYAANGIKLIKELVKLSPQPVHIRTHFLLTTGDSTGGLKWGSTNAYTEDASGKPTYDWTTVDRILNTFVKAGAVPFVEIGFMPKALSSRPDPYTPAWKPHGKDTDYYIGWTYPPVDYGKWGELVYQWVRHSVEKFGKAEVEKWDWEVWNEPNISYWHGTPEEYDKLYDYAAAAVKRALPTARVGGPATTGPRSEKAAAFLRQFLEHCANGKNFATGTTGSPLDFITFHAKGAPKVIDGRVHMGLSQELSDVERGFSIVRDFPKFKQLPIVLSEADPEGCAACSARVYPQNAYRNGTLYPSYTASALKALIDMADRDSANLQGILTWAFEFEDQPYFDGFRTLATNGVDKPVLNLFRMAGLMAGTRVKTTSTGGVELPALVSGGVPGRQVDAIATAGERRLAILLWNYTDRDGEGEPAPVSLTIHGLPNSKGQLQLRHYRIDDDHSNAYTVWKKLGLPQKPAPAQYRELEKAGQLAEFEKPKKIRSDSGEAKLDLTLPSHGLSLVTLSW